MTSGFKVFLQRWIISTLAALVAAYLVKGITYDKPLDLLMATLVLGILNNFIRPLLILLSLPLVVLTLGLFTLVINASLLLVVGWMLQPAFQVNGFGSAFWGGLIMSLVTLVLNTLTGTGQSRVTLRRPNIRSGKDDEPPVIDV